MSTNLFKNHPKFSIEEIHNVLKTYGTMECAKILETSTHSIINWRKKTGIPNPFKQSQIARKFQINHEFFSTIDSEEKAYILGLLAADGNINPDKYGCEIRLQLHPQDEDILIKVNKAWGSTYPIKTHIFSEKSGFPGSNREQKKLSIRSSKMRDDLAKYRIVPNKTLILRYPDIPAEYDRHFLRGFLDGDGHITHQEFGWVTNYGMSNDIQRICMKHGFPELRRYQIKEHSYCVKGGPKYHELIKWMYDGATISLDRKQKKFDEFWKNRVYKEKLRGYKLTKHIPCVLEDLPPVLGSIP